MKDAKLAIEQGNLMVLNSEQKKSVTMRKAALSYLPNGELLDGAQVQFKNNLMDATLGIIFLKKQSISQTRLPSFFSPSVCISAEYTIQV